MNRPKQERSAQVPTGAKPAEEAHAAKVAKTKWQWVEAAVWNSRMLAALENGVLGGAWYSLNDKVQRPDNLWSAWSKTARNKGAPGVDGITIDRYERDVETNLAYVSEQLRTGQYQPQSIRRARIPKGDGTTRPLGIPTVRDRIVQGAVRHTIEPIFENLFAEHSYGFRPGRGSKDALRRVDKLLKEGYRHVVDADLKSYFDTIPHDRLMRELRRHIADGKLLHLIESFLHAHIMEQMVEYKPTSGAPQGAVLSPLLSNIYLNPLDHLMVQSGYEMVRYADDFVILCQTETQAQSALELVRQWTAQAALTLHPEKTRIADAVHDGFEFLGYRFHNGHRYPRDKSLKKLRQALRERTGRSQGKSIESVIKTINPVLRGWFNYFKHSHRNTFGTIDGWIRMRLRSILRKYAGKRGRGRGNDHQRWPNAYFAKRGLYSLQKAHAQASQSMKMVH